MSNDNVKQMYPQGQVANIPENVEFVLDTRLAAHLLRVLAQVPNSANVYDSYMELLRQYSEQVKLESPAQADKNEHNESQEGEKAISATSEVADTPS